ncbi:unnamed protein product [Mytilus coruscus]|uniref:Uncharacterized protein n=1 Tax=Mytilus coruscus TaxID=42192 RepID=A0A6J8CU09_MYTCO|nr:unnamed protein product [Mytilus coruscus]
MPQAEVSQQSSVQSERTTGEIPSLENSTCLPLGQQLYKWLIQHFDEGIYISDMLRFYIKHLNFTHINLGCDAHSARNYRHIGINEEHRKACQQAAIMSEILLTFLLKNTYYYTGSLIEGTFASDESPFMYYTENKPALKTKNYHGTSVDNNIVCQFKTWPTLAQEWISRDRLFAWPTNSMVQQLSLLGFFVVKKGHPLSPEKDLERRASFSLQERKLMLSMTYYLWSILHRTIHTDIITEHTTKETKDALSSLLPQIYTCLASNIAAIAIKNINPKVRNFLLLGSFTYFMKGNLTGKLKCISVLYGIGLYEECEWYIDQLDEEYIKYAPSFCGCRILSDNVLEASMNITPQENVSTCVSFLSAELPITPLKYEMFRCFGISVTKEERAHTSCQWHYRAVVDCNFYFLFFKFLIKQKRRRIEEFTYIKAELDLLLSRHQVRHRDVALNLMAWISTSVLHIPGALRFLTLSWNYMNSLDLCLCIITEEMKRKQYQFNAAKLHALVVLFKTCSGGRPGRRKNLSIVVADSAKKKFNQRVPTTTSVPALQLPTFDSAIIPVTSSAGTNPMLYATTGAGIYTSASTCPVDSTSTANTLLYSRVPDQREFSTVNSQDPPEHL